MNVKVWAWGKLVGVAALDESTGRVVFEYDPEFIETGQELSPIHLPLRPGPVSPRVPDHFMGLPGLLADSLPDRFGQRLIDAYVAGEGRDPRSFGPIERLCYVGTRGMGALEYRPAKGPVGTKRHPIDLEEMVEIAGEAVRDRDAFSTYVSEDRKQAVKDILSIGTSAGGARAKAVIAYNRETGQIRSGQVDAGPGFEHYLLKFDGVSSDPSREDLGSSTFHGRIEFAYSLMARAAGIEMTECRLLEENGRAHFMTKRFDRIGQEKVHLQTLSALTHHDFELPYSYEQALRAAKQIGVPLEEREELVLRAMFNVTFRNQDDHAKNISFLLRDGGWHLSPAYDLTFAFNPQGANTYRHQMAVNGKFAEIDKEDFRQLIATAGLRKSLLNESLDRLESARAGWDSAVEEAGLVAFPQAMSKALNYESL